MAVTCEHTLDNDLEITRLVVGDIQLSSHLKYNNNIKT